MQTQVRLAAQTELITLTVGMAMTRLRAVAEATCYLAVQVTIG